MPDAPTLSPEDRGLADFFAEQVEAAADAVLAQLSERFAEDSRIIADLVAAVNHCRTVATGGRSPYQMPNDAATRGILYAVRH